MSTLKTIIDFLGNQLFSIGDNRITILSLILLFLTMLAAFLLSRYISTLFNKKIGPRLGVERGAFNTLSFIIRIGIFFLALVVVLQITGLGLSLFNVTLFTIKETSVTVVSLLNLVLIVGLTLFGVRLLLKLLESRVYPQFEIDIGLQHTISTLLKYIMVSVGFFVALENIGFDLSVLTAFAAILMVGIGFGLQNIANNFISGLIILFERPIKVGDYIAVGNIYGNVSTISARSTTVTTTDNIKIIIPNADFLAKAVTNWSHTDVKTRIHIEIGVAYGSDTEQVRQILLQMAEQNPYVIKKPSPKVRFLDFGDSSLNFSLMIWIKKPRMHQDIRSDLNFAIDKAFRENGVEIPFPQRDLHLRSAVAIPCQEA